MKLELVDQARKILFTSWAARLGVIAAVLQALAEFQDQLPLIRDYVPHNLFSLLAILCAISVPLARVVKQAALHEGQTVPDLTIPPQALAAVVQVAKDVLTAHIAQVAKAAEPLTANNAPPPPVLNIPPLPTGDQVK